MSINWWMDKDSVASLYNGLLFGNILQHGWISKALCWVKEARCERTLLHDSVCIKCPAKANIQRQKTEEWLPGAQRGGHKGWMQAGTGILGSHGKCSKIESWWWLHNLVNLLKIMIELYTKLSECYGPSTTLKKKNKQEEHVSCWQVVPCLQPCWGRPAEQWSHLAQRKVLSSCTGSPWFISFALLIRPWKADEDTAFKGSAYCLHQLNWLSNPNKHSLLCQPLTFPWSL